MQALLYTLLPSWSNVSKPQHRGSLTWLVSQGTVDSTGKPVDPAFYRTFWGLQAIFQQPYSAIHPDTWVKVLYSASCSACPHVWAKPGLPACQATWLRDSGCCAGLHRHRSGSGRVFKKPMCRSGCWSHIVRVGIPGLWQRCTSSSDCHLIQSLRFLHEGCPLLPVTTY